MIYEFELEKAQAKIINLSHADIYLRDQGEGIPTLFLHGVPDTGDMWLPVISQLEGKFRSIAPDLPGMGRSIAHETYEPTLDNMADLVNELLDALGISEPINIVVTDFGGTYGLAWAVKYPHRVRKLAVAGGINFFSDYKWHPMAQILRTPILGELSMATMTYKGFAMSLRQNTPAFMTDAYLRKAYASSFAKPSIRNWIMKHYRTTDVKNFVGWEDKLIRLMARIPSLVLWGDKDPYIAPEFAERFGAQEVIHFPEYGHWLAVESPDEVANILRKFLG